MKPRTAIPQGDQLVPDSVVWTEFGVTRMALYRWDRDPDLNFIFPPFTSVVGNIAVAARSKNSKSKWSGVRLPSGTLASTPASAKRRCDMQENAPAPGSQPASNALPEIVSLSYSKQPLGKLSLPAIRR